MRQCKPRKRKKRKSAICRSRLIWSSVDRRGKNRRGKTRKHARGRVSVSMMMAWQGRPLKKRGQEKGSTASRRARYRRKWTGCGRTISTRRPKRVVAKTMPGMPVVTMMTSVSERKLSVEKKMAGMPVVETMIFASERTPFVEMKKQPVVAKTMPGMLAVENTKADADVPSLVVDVVMPTAEMTKVGVDVTTLPVVVGVVMAFDMFPGCGRMTHYNIADVNEGADVE